MRQVEIQIVQRGTKLFICGQRSLCRWFAKGFEAELLQTFGGEFRRFHIGANRHALSLWYVPTLAASRLHPGSSFP